MQVLVLGAAGFVGLHVVDALRAAGVDPLAGRRRTTNTLVLRKRRVPLVRADLDDPEGLAQAMRGVDVVVHAAGHYPRTALDPDGSLALGVRQTRAVLDAAATAGVRRLVYVSSTATVAPADGPATEAHVFPGPPGFGVYHDLKWHMEARVLGERRLETVVACPAGCLGPWDLRVGTSALLVATARGLAPPHPDGVVNLVDVGDVGRAVAALATHPAPPRRVLLSGHTRRLQGLLEDLSVRYRVAPPSAPLTDDDARRYADTEERRAAQQGGRAAIAREIVDLVVHGVPVDASLAERTLGARWTPLDDTLDAFDAWARRLGIVPPPRTETPA